MYAQGIVLKFFGVLALVGFALATKAQYIDKAQVEPWGACPTVCGDGSFRVKLFLLQGQNSIGGNTELTIMAGGQQLEITRYSLDNGNSWTNGSFPVNDGTNQTDIIFDVSVPDGALSAGSHPIQLGLANGFVSGSQFEGDGCNSLTVQIPGAETATPSFPDKWTGYVFDDGGPKTCFFEEPYDGIVEINDLNFSNDYGGDNGGTANFPGTAGTNYDFSDLNQTYGDYFSVRFVRTETFDAGVYSIDMSYDDGVRLYVDGELLLNDWGQNDIANNDIPKLCLDGETELQLDYYQWRYGAELTINFTNLGTVNLPVVEYPTACLGDVVSPITTQDPGTYSFNPLPSDGALIDPNSGEVTLPAGGSASTYTIEFVETNGECANPVSGELTTQACDNPSFTIADYCEGDAPPAPELSSDWVAGGTWSIAPNDGTTIDANGQITGGVAGETYTVTYEYNSGGVQTLTDDVTVNALDDATFSYADVCEGETSTPTLGPDFTTGGTYTLDVDPGDGVTVDGTTGAVSGGTAANSPYTITYTTTGDCPVTGQATVSFGGAGEATFTYAAWCEDAANSNLPVLDAQTTTGGTYSFDPAPGDGAIIDGGTGEISNWTAGTVYSVNYDTGGDCPANSTVEVTTIGATVSISYDPFCAGGDSDTPIPGADYVAGGTYSFTADPGDGATIDPTTGVISDGVYATGSYDVTYEVANSCGGGGTLTAQATATILESVEVLIHPTNQAVCDGDQTVFTMDGNPDAITYQWQVNSGTAWNDIQAGGEYDGIDAYALTVTGIDDSHNGNQYRAVISNACGSATTDPATLTVNAAVIQITGDTIICSGETTTLFATEGMDSYTWVSSTTGNAVLSDSSSVEVTPSVPTTYTVFGTGLASGCEAVKNASVEVVIDPFPDAGPDIEVCPDAQVVLGTNVNSQWSYEWYHVPTDEVVGISRTYSLTVDSATSYAVVATTIEGCSRADTVNIELLSDMTYWVPNSFTPNIDGQNEVFGLVGEGIVGQTLEIFDRWGERLAEIEGVGGTWDGTYEEVLCKPDVYVYKFNLSSECSFNEKVIGRVTIFH